MPRSPGTWRRRGPGPAPGRGVRRPQALCPGPWHALDGCGGDTGGDRRGWGRPVQRPRSCGRRAGSRQDPGTPTERGRHWLDFLQPRSPCLGSLRWSKSPATERRGRCASVPLTTRPLWPAARRPDPSPVRHPRTRVRPDPVPRRAWTGAIATVPRAPLKGRRASRGDQDAVRRPPRDGHRGAGRSGSRVSPSSSVPGP